MYLTGYNKHLYLLFALKNSLCLILAPTHSLAKETAIARSPKKKKKLLHLDIPHLHTYSLVRSLYRYI